MPETKSMYSRPSGSVTTEPSAVSTTTGVAACRPLGTQRSRSARTSSLVRPLVVVSVAMAVPPLAGPRDPVAQPLQLFRSLERARPMARRQRHQERVEDDDRDPGLVIHAAAGSARGQRDREPAG